MATLDYDIYKSTEGRKRTYVVSKYYYDACKGAERYFHVSENKTTCVSGWVIGDSLYFDDIDAPRSRNRKSVWIAYRTNGGTRR